MDTSPAFGHVNAGGESFRNGVFAPFNDAYAAFHPDLTLGDTRVDATLPPLNPGEYFQVREEIDKSEGLRGTMAAGNFLHYPSAYRAAAGKNVQGGRGRIVIISPAGARTVTALGEDGQEVVMATIPVFRTVDMAARLIFSQPWDSTTTKESS